MREGGFTLIELTVVMTLSLVVLAAVWNALNAAVVEADTASSLAHLDSRMRLAIDRISAEVADSGQEADGTDHVTSHPKGADGSDNQVTFEPRVDFTGDPLIDWTTPVQYVLQAGAENTANGVDDDGDGLVDESRLVRLESDGTSRLIIDNVRTFVVTRVAGEDLLTIQLQIETVLSPGTGAFSRNMTTTFALNNRD